MSGFIFGGVNRSKIELFFGGFRDYNKKLSSRINFYFQEQF